MKKFLLILILITVLLLGGAYLKLFARQASYQKTIVASTNSVLVLGNFDRGKVKIITADTDEITLNLKGSAEDILSILMAESGIYTELEFPEGLSGITGTITVPEGMLMDVSLSGGRTITIDDVGGERVITGEDSFLVDTSTLESFTVDDSGNVFLDSWGNLTVWDDEKWDTLDGNGDDGTDNIVYCGIGSQAIRDYCCETENENEDTPDCNGISHWIFDNSARACSFACEVNESVPVDEPADCGIGSQAERDLCCSDQYVGVYQGCIGTWRYNNLSQTCQFDCYSYDSYDPYDPVDDPDDDSDGGEEVVPFSYGDAVSDYCVTIISDEDRDFCCNDTLKNNLSSGPRPGFPDCIGTWQFNIELGCDFECAEHSEMMEILNELRQQI